ncbi:hypothetical protein ID866_3218 [Astraeus odoratus]|nr:hypothetical protein ID866_3218 [Astraeus odoratus]
MSNTAPKKIFGGAISVVLPTEVLDASDIRQVPDSQELFLYLRSDSFLSIEVLERVPEDDDLEAAKFHFDAVADDNDAIEPTVKEVRHLGIRAVSDGSTLSPVFLRGTQKVQKFGREDPQEVEILIALWRIQVDDRCADIVVSANIPDPAEIGAVEEDFGLLVDTFYILDYGLFA